MAILNGTELKVYAGHSGTTNLVAFAQNCTLNINMATREITNKESGGFKEVLESTRDYSLDVDGAYAWTNAAGADVTDGIDDLVGTNVLGATRTPVTFTFGDNQTTDDVYYQGTGYITSVSITGGTEDTATYSLSIEGTGSLAKGEV